MFYPFPRCDRSRICWNDRLRSSWKGSLNFSLEFKGGTSISADFGKDYTVEQVEDKIVPEVAKVINDNAIQASTVSGSNVVTIKQRH